MPWIRTLMNLEIKSVFAEEIEVLAELRVQFVLDLHPEYAGEAEELRRAIREYLAEHLKQKRYIGFLGRSADKIACSAGLLLYDLPPLRLGRTRQVGHVLNFYTVPEFRRCGVGRQLMDFIISEAKLHGITRLVLNATKQGEPLYRKAGFHEQDEVNLIKEL